MVRSSTPSNQQTELTHPHDVFSLVVGPSRGNIVGEQNQQIELSAMAEHFEDDYKLKPSPIVICDGFLCFPPEIPP